MKLKYLETIFRETNYKSCVMQRTSRVMASKERIKKKFKSNLH